MKTLSGKEFIKVLEKKGWHLEWIHSSHHILSHPGKIEIISVPVHENDDLKKGLQKKLMSIADLRDNEL